MIIADGVILRDNMLGILSQKETENMRQLIREIAEAAGKIKGLYSNIEHKQLTRYGKITSRPFTVYEGFVITTIHTRILTQERKNEQPKEKVRRRRVGQTFFKYPKAN